MYRRQYALALICCAAALSVCALAGKTSTPSVHFLDRTYHLVSFDQKTNPTWEFLTGKDTADDWTTRFTIIDRPEAHSKADLKAVVDGITSDYAARGGKVLMAKVMDDANGQYNYTVIGTDDAAKQRYELSFLKIALNKKNGYVAVYSVRISDPKDRGAKTKVYLREHSLEVGNALGQAELPSMDKLPRTGL